MAELIVLDGCTFFSSDETGDTSSKAHGAFFNEDVRHLSRWELLVDGKPIDLLTSERVDYCSAPHGSSAALATTSRSRSAVTAS